ncbi:MAG TPA: hypothetical protein VK832_17855, partial [Burkholderiaceae bacterium]|nr:hypothetical protein [Burkholderiaceae bacterium]
MDEVAAFYFSRLPDSYAARTGRPDNIGVIGIAVFQEYVEPVAMQEQSIERAAPSAPVPGTLAKRADNAAGAPADPKIGTGHGERLTSNTWMTDFHRIGTQPNEVLIIYYDTYAHLATRGIIPGGHENVQGPLPFPGKFVPDPS